MTATAVEILPCPFCGGEATLQGKEGARHWYVICEDSEECDASGPDKTTREEAIAAWNIRSRYRPSRDALARILYPEAFSPHQFDGDPDWHPDDNRYKQLQALGKTDAVIAILFPKTNNDAQ